MSKHKSPQSAFQYVTIGLQLAITVLLFIFGGYYLDNRYNKSPIFLTIGAALGMIIGFYHLMKQVQDIEKREKLKKNEDNKKKVKWM